MAPGEKAMEASTSSDSKAGPELLEYQYDGDGALAPGVGETK